MLSDGPLASNSLSPGASSQASMLREWFQSWAERREDADAPADQQLGIITALASRLARATTLVSPSPGLFAQLGDALRPVPVQLAYLEATDPAAQWLSIAALAESLAAPVLAHVVLDGLVRHVDTAAPGASAVDVGGVDPSELLGLCWSRRGRLARLGGTLEEAELCYREAIRCVARGPWRDARPTAEIGLVNVSVARGNYPDAERRLRRILLPANGTAPMHRIAAYQLQALARRKRGDRLNALLDSWRAHDLMEPHDVRRAEVVVSVAETALELGDTDAALRGFLAARDMDPALRVRVAALIGVVRVLLVDAQVEHPPHGRTQEHRGTDAPITAACVEACRALEAVLDAPLAPRERVAALLTLTDAALLSGHVPAERVDQWIAEAEQLAHRHQFHDHAFRADAVREAWAAQRTRSSAHPTAPEIAQSSPELTPTQQSTADVVGAHAADARRHPALQRLVTLSTT